MSSAIKSKGHALRAWYGQAFWKQGPYYWVFIIYASAVQIETRDYFGGQ